MITVGNFWTEVDEALDRSKEGKLIKVRAKDLGDLRSKMTELENEISIAQNKIQTLSEIKLDQAKQIELLQKSQSSLDHTIESQIYNQSEMIEELERELKDKQDKLGMLTGKASKKDRLILEFKQKLDEGIQKIKGQFETIDELERQNALLSEQLTKAQKQLELAQSKSALTDDQVAIAKEQETKLNNLIRLCKRYEVDLKSRDAEIHSLKEDFLTTSGGESIDSLKSKLAATQGELEQISLDIKQERQEFTALKGSMNQELELAQAKIAELEDEKELAISELEKDILHLKNAHQQEIEHLMLQKGESLSKLSERGEAGNIDPQVPDLIQKLRVSNAKVQELQLKNRKLLNQIEKSEGERKTLEKRVKRFERNSVPREEFDTAQKALRQIKEKFEAVRKNREILLSENDSLRMQLEQYHEAQETAQPAAQSSTEASSRLKPPQVEGSAPKPKTTSKGGAIAPVPEFEEDESVVEVSLHTTRLVCPRCNSTKLKEVDDKTRIISYVPQTTYAKKTICTQCGYSFK